MAQWKKVIVSGSSAQLNQLSVDTSLNITGSLNAASTVKLTGLTNVSQASIVGIDTATGQLYYQGTGSFTANSASYALSASYAQSASRAISAADADNAISASRAVSAANADTASVLYTSAGPVIINAGQGTNAVQITGSLMLGTGGSAGGATGSFTGSFTGDGAGLTNVPASGIVGLQLNQIGSGSVTASISPDLGFRVNTNSQITGSLIVSSNINSAGNVVATGADSSLSGSFTGSFAGTFVGTSNLPDLTQGTGISTFTYDGASTATVAVSGAAALSANTVTKWSGDAFVDSSITDSTNVTINNAGGVLVQTGGLYVTGASTFHDNVVMQGNLTVQGTASFQNVENLAVKDQFVLLNSGSSTFQDSGIVINTGNAQNSGSAFFLETAGTTTGTDALNGRFAVGSGILPDATTATAAEYAVTALISGSAPGAAVPQWGGTNLGQGNMWVDSSTSDVWIYA
jgi:hypothetical protein